MNMMTISELLKTNEQNRDFSWDEKFFKVFSEQQVRLLSQDPQQGPDGWPYIICETLGSNDSAETANDQIESTQKLFHWLADRGIGLVVNPRRQPYPDYVFSFGMIWNFRQTGYFIQPDLITRGTESSEVDYQNKKIYTGAPTEAYLPLTVRKVLKDFFRDQAVLDPKVLMISTDQKNYDFCISLESIGNPPATEHSGVAEAISWFLPTHYSIVLVSENGLPEFSSL
jgi:hypothetical protein